AAAYAATGDLTRAQARLALLGDNNPIEALNAQAQRMRASGTGGVSFEEADQVVALAAALDQNGINPPRSTDTETAVSETVDSTSSPPTSTAALPSDEPPLELTETPASVETPLDTPVAATPRPTRTPVATFGAPFGLTGQDSVCDPNLPDGLLQVLILNSNRRQMPGIEILITWEGGAENFFTGLKPELGNGYADYIMTPDITYTVQLRAGSDIASGLTAPTCQTPSGEAFFGGIKLTFQQP
ncbi:MAG TPA: hypothetical protein VFQ23_08130, partial [Anaerolineales bacterium]|nr:hypothetical protein [Anaerolineales bacterium]